MADRVDDGAVADDEVLWRRVLSDWIERSDPPRGRSMAFLDRRSGELSVHRAKLTSEEVVLDRYPTHGIIAIKASVPRSLGYKVVADPIVNEPDSPDDPSHALIIPPEHAGSSRTKSLAKELAKSSTVVREPRNEAAHPLAPDKD